MQSGFKNGQRYWISLEGNAIWMRHAGDQWNIGPSEFLGKDIASLIVPIKDPSKECPHDDPKSNWKYGKGKKFAEDVSNEVRIHCLRGKFSPAILMQSNYEMTYLFQDVGELQFMKNEFLVAPNASIVEVIIERINSVKDNVKVNWKLTNNDLTTVHNGTLIFNNQTNEKVTKLYLQNVNRNKSASISLFDPTNSYQLGEIKVANISFVCKFIETSFFQFPSNTVFSRYH